MPDMARFRPVVEAKSGAPPLSCNAAELRSRLGYDAAAMRSSGFDPSIIAEHEAFSGHLAPFVAHHQFGKYLADLTPQEVYGASGVSMLTLDGIRDEIQPGSCFSCLLPHGYIPFATSVGGNAICFHAPTGRVVWADHDSFHEDMISYKDRGTGGWHDVPFSPENIELAVLPLAGDYEAFLADLLADRLEEGLDELD